MRRLKRTHSIEIYKQDCRHYSDNDQTSSIETNFKMWRSIYMCACSGAMMQRDPRGESCLFRQLLACMLAMLSSTSCWKRCTRSWPQPNARMVGQPVMVSVSELSMGDRDTISRRFTWRTVA